ncbi:hypothetical protein NKDENANG_00227 [Candidatus Entotheonellaceae bacterium PAL068K]
MEDITVACVGGPGLSPSSKLYSGRMPMVRFLRCLTPLILSAVSMEGVKLDGKTRYVFTAAMDIDPAKEGLFNEVYDTEHVPLLLKVPGVMSVTRYVQEPFEMIIGGETRQVSNPGEPKYAAVYEIESPDVLKSRDWADAVDQGRWPTEVRPYTFNRRHTLQQVVDG